MNRARERLLVVALALACALGTSTPWLRGYLSAPAGHRFAGWHLLNAADTYLYVSLIEQARGGHVLFANLHTPDEHPRFSLRPTYVVGGWLARLGGLEADRAYHVLRAIAVVLCVGALHALSLRFLARPRDRLAFLVVALTASGLGWLPGGAAPSAPAGDVLLVARRSTDLWMPETVTFLSLYESPHFTVSIALLVAIVAAVADGCRDSLVAPTAWTAPAAGVATALLALEHPYDVVALAPVLAAYVAARRVIAAPALDRRAYVVLASAAAGVVAGLAYHAAVLHLVPVAAAWSRQNLLPSPPPACYLQGQGLLVPLAAVGARELSRTRPPAAALLGLGATLPFALAYAPVAFQRRLVEGAPVPLALLATVALLALWDRGRPALRALVAAVALLLPLSNVLVVAGDLAAFGRRGPPYYFADEVPEALLWLREHSPGGSVVLCEPNLGNVLPGISGRRAYVGHRQLTVDFDRRAREARELLEGRPAALSARADYAITGSLFGEGPPGPAPAGFREVHRNARLAIFERAPR